MTIVQDMKEMTFPGSSFDVIWSAGAIYNLDFETGLKAFKNLVKPGGYVAVSEARNEISVFRKYSDDFNYAFFTMRKPT